MELFRDINSLAERPPSRQKAKLISLLLDCELVETVQKMWRRYLSPELLDQMEKLPDHLETSLAVGQFSHLCVLGLCNNIHITHAFCAVHGCWLVTFSSTVSQMKYFVKAKRYSVLRSAQRDFYPCDAMRRAGLSDSNVSVRLSVRLLQPVLYQNGKS